MTVLTIHLANKLDVKLVEHLVKSLNGTIEKKEEESPYNPEFVAKILKSSEEAKNGNTVSIDLKSLWK